MDMMKMMQQAQEMQKKIAKMQESMQDERVEGTAGGGAIKVTLSGTGEAIAIHIESDLLAEQNVLQDLLVTAFNDARRRQAEREKERTAEIMGNIPMPGGFKLPFSS